MDSILTSIKKLLGIDVAYTDFDTDIIMHINTAMMSLTLLGVGPPGGFIITDASQLWSDLLGEDNITIEACKSYVFLQVRLIFDPPQNSFVIGSIEKQIEAMLWKISTQVELTLIANEGV